RPRANRFATGLWPRQLGQILHGQKSRAFLILPNTKHFLSCPVRTGVSGVACLRSLDFFLVWLGEFCHLARLNSTNKSSLAMNRTSAWRKTERASALVKGLVAALVALGLVAGVIWHFHHGAVKQPGVDDSGGLSDGTRKVLKNLD